jgi:hypothetical protein
VTTAVQSNPFSCIESACLDGTAGSLPLLVFETGGSATTAATRYGSIDWIADRKSAFLLCRFAMLFELQNMCLKSTLLARFAIEPFSPRVPGVEAV